MTLTGAGYTLTFVVPAVTVGGTATMTADLQASPPPGAPSLQVRPGPPAGKPVTPGAPSARGRAAKVSPAVVGGNVSGLVYLVTTTTATVEFSSTPGFSFTMPSGTSIPAGQYAYLVYYDPYASASGWQALRAGNVSGQSVIFPALSSGVTLHANAQYVYALGVTTSPVATASPMPTPTPTPAPTATPISPPSSPTPGAIPPSCPPGPPNTFPMGVANNTGIASKLLVYAYGLTNGSPAVGSYVPDATSGQFLPDPAAGSPMPSFTMPPSGCINLPPGISVRLYFYFQTDSTDPSNVTSNGPSSNANPPNVSNSLYKGDINNVFDYLEYTWNPPADMYLDVSAVDGVGIPISFSLKNAGQTLGGPVGLPQGALSTSITQLKAQGDPWTGIIQQTATSGTGGVWSRIVSPQNAFGATSGLTFDASYYTNILQTIWNTYTGSNFLHLSYPGQFNDAYGVSNGAGTPFNFYASASTSSTLLATIPYPTTSQDVFGNSGAFAANSSGPDGLFVGRALSVNILRGTLPVPNPLPAGWPSGVQPFCGTNDWQYFYNGYLNGTTLVPGATVDWYAAIVHGNALALSTGIKPIYGFPDDDECNYTSGPLQGNGLYEALLSAPYAAGDQWGVTLNPF